MLDLMKYATKAIRQRPELKEEIEDLIQLYSDEIEAGESQEHEIELCREDIRQLIEED